MSSSSSRILRTPRTRRQVLGGVAGGVAATVASGSLLPGILAARKAPAYIQGGGKLTYWGGLIFSDAANQMLTDTINQWGADNGVEVEVVMINQNETQQKVSAAVESGTMPSALDLGLGLAQLLSTTGELQDLGALYDKIGAAQGGWFESIDSAVDPALLGGARTGVPFGSGGNILFRRLDVLEEAGITTAPTTWQELSDFAAQAQQPGVYGLGLALSNVGDGNLQSVGSSVLWRPDRRRRRTEMHDQVRRNPRLPRVGHCRLGSRSLPAGRHDLGWGGRQHGLPLRPGDLHCQPG